MQLDDAISTKLAARVMGTTERTLIASVPTEMVGDERVVRIGDLVGRPMRRKARLEDFEEFEEHPEFFGDVNLSGFLTVAAAAERLGADADAVLRWTQSGKIGSKLIDGVVYIPVRELNAIGGNH
jgi:hypothetical protein